MYEINGKYTSAKIFTEVEDIDVTEQTLAICNHPIFKDCEVRIMPDCHKGKGCTIGFTAEMPKNGEIIPNIIGVDQFCGMHVIKLDDKDIPMQLMTDRTTKVPISIEALNQIYSRAELSYRLANASQVEDEVVID